MCASESAVSVSLYFATWSYAAANNGMLPCYYPRVAHTSKFSAPSSRTVLVTSYSREIWSTILIKSPACVLLKELPLDVLTRKVFRRSFVRLELSTEYISRVRVSSSAELTIARLRWPFSIAGLMAMSVDVALS